jgi:chemotaxis protein methyltransferase CheR
MGQLKTGGHLIIGHSESLNGIVDELKALMPSVYCKP